MQMYIYYYCNDPKHCPEYSPEQPQWYCMLNKYAKSML